MSELPAWVTAKDALDQHETIEALYSSLPDLTVSYPQEEVAELQAAALGRQGYVLVRAGEMANGFLTREGD